MKQSQEPDASDQWQQLQEWHDSSTAPLALTLRWHSPIDGHQEQPVRYHRDQHGLRAALGEATIPLDQPVALGSVAIAKPWGQEIWFTGIEARGESCIRVGGHKLPLSAYLALAPQWTHASADIVLLKILDPKPEPVLGDLYFEVHERKEETYVVTAVDQDAWPQGQGAIRYGVNQALRAQYQDDGKFREAYLQAVAAYERVRRLLDDEMTPADAIAAGDNELGQASAAAAAAIETQRRQTMETFTELLPLAVGDIVSVPPWHPHSLQHGVQVVEFQSPTYERFIISFAQQVQTQNHWDSATAIARMSLEPLTPEPPMDPGLPEGVRRIADYRDFGALRIALTPAANAFRVRDDLPYAVVICIAGELRCGSLQLTSGAAAFIPGLALRAQLDLISDDCLLLIAAPGL